jgi:hypothetical protein
MCRKVKVPPLSRLSSKAPDRITITYSIGQLDCGLLMPEKLSKGAASLAYTSAILPMVSTITVSLGGVVVGTTMGDYYHHI